MIWIKLASLCKKEWNSKEYEYVEEEIYDHYPTEEETLWLMAKYEALRCSYVQISEAFREEEYCEYEKKI